MFLVSLGLGLIGHERSFGMALGIYKCVKNGFEIGCLMMEKLGK